MIRLLVIADDFTGGLDTGVQFAGRGIPTCVLTEPEADFAAEAGACEVLVVVAETRHLTAKEAYETVLRAARKGVELGAAHIYKKTDSALRGNIGAELTAVKDAAGAALMPFVPALPAMNRVTRGGIQYIDGVPVAESVFGRDPFEPVKESDIPRLIALQSDTPAFLVKAEEIAGKSGIGVLDAESTEDLEHIAGKLRDVPGLRVSAGCAGFAAMLPGLLGLAARKAPEAPRLASGLFVLCGSVNPITQRQLDRGEEQGFTRIHIAPEAKLHPEFFRTPEGKALLAQWKKKMAESPWMILDANDTDPANRETAERARMEGFTTEDVRQRISESMGIILSEMMDPPAERTLLITGGDTLLKSMNRMKIRRMVPLAEAAPGCVLSRVAYKGRDWPVITKSGGFGQETLLQDLKDLIVKRESC